ncbi:MAG: 1-acyl-sn-glycerol-3-phosphate acyltransferase, partial [Candidatus Cloacimonetes bacterium]|nr:1-acyl-sn-glycerol-3-phosphate acyltransferase [Candidatus Cloacimonadota bacterium]
AVDAQCPVLPVCIRYLGLDGQPIGDNNRDRITWYGDMTFLPHHWRLLGHSIEARVSFLEPIAFDPSRTRSELADLVRGRLLESFHAGEHPANHIDKEK